MAMEYLNKEGLTRLTDKLKANYATKSEAQRGGIFYGTCTTPAATAAKTCTIANYLLVPGAVVRILFSSAINVADPTLNISSTGAKPIYLGGVSVTPGVVRPGCTLIMRYTGTNYNILSIEGLEQSQSPSDLYVDMGLPSGLLWATRNIDITQPNGFAESLYQYGCSYFSWGNTDGHNPNGTSFDYNWGGVNAEEPYYDGQPYGSTPGNKITSHIAAPMDCARVNLGAPWRLPTSAEYGELFNNIDYLDASGNVIDSSVTNKLITYNGVVGIRLRSKTNGNELFFACCGYGAGTSLSSRGSSGDYWSSSWNSARSARYLYFGSSGVYPQSNDNRYYGFSVRAVQ